MAHFGQCENAAYGRVAKLEEVDRILKIADVITFTSLT